LGRSVRGRPLHLVRIGAERARHTALIVCSQHGNEPAAREACLRQIRRLAFTDDARTAGYLRSTAVYFIPAANPDGRALNTRGNADGLDLNRDHLRLGTVEARAMARALRDVRPDFVADLHEFGTLSPDRPALEVIWPRHLNVDEDVRSLGREWGDDWVRPRAEANGFSTGPYVANPGTGENITILNAAGLRHAVAVLAETRTSALPGEPDGVAFVQRRRVATQDMALHESLRFHREQAGEIAREVADARRRKTRAGRFRKGPYYWYGNSEDPGPPPADAILERPPCGYLLTPKQAASVRPWIRGFDVTTVRLDGTVYVPMGQEAQPVIGLMLDGRSAGSNEVEGVPWPRDPIGRARCPARGPGG
jgi:Zinc carboxypeptidase